MYNGKNKSTTSYRNTFQAFMNHIFADMISEKWLKIYMESRHPHKGRFRPTSPLNLSSPVLSQGTWPFSQDFQVFLRYSHHGIPRNDHWSGSHLHGSCKTRCYQRLASPILCQGSVLLPWLCKLLLKVHSQLLQHRRTHHPPHSK